MPKFSVILAVGLLSCVQASADWQNTRWGMSLEEIRAIKPDLELTTPKERQDGNISIVGEPLAKGTHSTSDDTFKVYFHFRNRALAGVRLDAKEPQHAATIFNDLKLTYGPPTSVVDHQNIGGCLGYLGSWRDQPNRNEILFVGFACPESPNTSSMERARIIYQPILQPGERF